MSKAHTTSFLKETYQEMRCLETFTNPWFGQEINLFRLENGITLVILCVMKTAISIPDSIFETAEKFAERQGLSRSELYTRAVKEYLERNRNDRVTEVLNEIYEQESSEIDPIIKQMQFSSVTKEIW